MPEVADTNAVVNPDRPLSELECHTSDIEVDPATLRYISEGAQALFRHEGSALVAWGTGACLNVPGGLSSLAGTRMVSDLLASIQLRDAPEEPLALASMPFWPDEPVQLTIPAGWLRIKQGGQATFTTVTPKGSGPAPPGWSTPPQDRPTKWAPDAFELSSPVSHQEFCELISAALGAIEQGRLQKVVLAREVAVAANRGFIPAQLLERLEALFPTCMVFCLDGFLGASPELLMRRRGRMITTKPLAGTAAHTGDAQADELASKLLLSSAKNRAEHSHVIDGVSQALHPFCSMLELPDEPRLTPLRNVVHLGSEINGHLRQTPVTPDALGLAAALHPTPAVAGVPRKEALQFLRDHERLNRGRYAGPVGWVDASGDGEWWLGIRSAEVHGNHARLFAGVGIVEGSDPIAELAETQLKLQALLSALVRP